MRNERMASLDEKPGLEVEGASFAFSLVSSIRRESLNVVVYLREGCLKRRDCGAARSRGEQQTAEGTLWAPAREREGTRPG